MNLGQLIGELMMRVDHAGELPQTAAPPAPAPQGAKPRGARQHEVMALLEEGASLDVASIGTKLGISAEHAGVLMHTMATKGLISRHGQKRHYRYTKLGVPNPHSS